MQFQVLFRSSIFLQRNNHRLIELPPSECANNKSVLKCSKVHLIIILKIKRKLAQNFITPVILFSTKPICSVLFTSQPLTSLSHLNNQTSVQSHFKSCNNGKAIYNTQLAGKHHSLNWNNFTVKHYINNLTTLFRYSPSRRLYTQHQRQTPHLLCLHWLLSPLLLV